MSDDVQKIEGYDVVVVGGGPVGSTAARYAAKNGADVLIIEKRQEIGSPVRCAEGISFYWLDELGVEETEKWHSTTMKGAKIFSPSGYSVQITEEMAGEEVGAVIERDIFDKEMARMAMNQGADCRVKTSATGLIMEDGQVKGVKAKSMGQEYEISADIVVGADGFESQIGRWAGIYDSIPPKDIMTCFQYRMTNVEVDPDYTYFYLGSSSPGGYIWAFPKDENTANVGLGIQSSRLNGEKTPKDYLDEFIENNERYSDGRVIDMVAGGVSVTSPPEKVIGDGILLVGDAARVVDPITGGGIVNGLKQAKIAGQVIGEALANEDFSEEFLQTYEDRWRERLEDKLWCNYMAKEKAMELNDEQFDKVIDALSEVDLNKVNVETILKGIQEKYPELVEEFQDLL